MRLRLIKRIILSAVVVVGMCSLVIGASISPVRESKNPQAVVKTAIIKEDEQNNTLAKYEFMQNKKRAAEKKFKDELLIETKELAAQVDADVDEVYARKEILDSVKTERQVVESEVSLEELKEALATLNAVASELSVEVNDVPVVASGQENPIVTGALIAGDRVDNEYFGSVVTITGENRNNLERLVMGEAGNQGYVGAALVAQTIHDTMISDNQYDVLAIKAEHGYAGELDTEPSDTVKQAVAFIFDKGGMAVQHELKYFYAPSLVTSDFHEGCEFVVSYGGHKFFDDWE